MALLGNGNGNTKKWWVVYDIDAEDSVFKPYADFELAKEAAMDLAKKNNSQYAILEAVGVAKVPPPVYAKIQ